MLRTLLLLPAVLGGLFAGLADDDEGARAGDAGAGSTAGSTVDATASEAPACAAPQPGFLSVATSPWTAVLVDGARVGTTPLFRLPLAPGAHRIEFVNDDAGVAAHEDVDIAEGALKKLKLVFVSPDDGDAVLDESRAEAAQSEDDCLATDVDHAFLTVDVKPWARVIVDGRAVGTTPLFRHRVSLGSHRVLLVGPGGERVAARFDAADDETVKLALSFATPTEAAATSTPADATTAVPAFSRDQPR
jgi:hypothetical protein